MTLERTEATARIKAQIAAQQEAQTERNQARGLSGVRRYGRYDATTGSHSLIDSAGGERDARQQGIIGSIQADRDDVIRSYGWNIPKVPSTRWENPRQEPNPDQGEDDENDPQDKASDSDPGLPGLPPGPDPPLPADDPSSFDPPPGLPSNQNPSFGIPPLGFEDLGDGFSSPVNPNAPDLTDIDFSGRGSDNVPPFEGGQCEVAYNITYRGTANEGSSPGSGFDACNNQTGPISITTEVSGSLFEVQVRRGDGTVACSRAMPNSWTNKKAEVGSITRVDGQPDNCGDPPASPYTG